LVIDRKLPPAACKLAAHAALRLAKRPSLYVRKYLWTYPQPCIRLHRHVCRRLNNELRLKLGLNLNPSLFGLLFR